MVLESDADRRTMLLLGLQANLTASAKAHSIVLFVIIVQIVLSGLEPIPPRAIHRLVAVVVGWPYCGL